MLPVHGGEVQQVARQVLEAPGLPGCQCLAGALVTPLAAGSGARRDYPDRSKTLLVIIWQLSMAFSRLPFWRATALPNFTWAARDAAEQGLSVLPAPGFADYGRALRCWSGTSRLLKLPLLWHEAFLYPFPDRARDRCCGFTGFTTPPVSFGAVHLGAFAERYALVICDEAFASSAQWRAAVVAPFG